MQKIFFKKILTNQVLKSDKLHKKEEIESFLGEEEMSMRKPTRLGLTWLFSLLMYYSQAQQELASAHTAGSSPGSVPRAWKTAFVSRFSTAGKARVQ